MLFSSFPVRFASLKSTQINTSLCLRTSSAAFLSVEYTRILSSEENHFKKSGYSVGEIIFTWCPNLVKTSAKPIAEPIASPSGFSCGTMAILHFVVVSSFSTCAITSMSVFFKSFLFFEWANILKLPTVQDIFI